MLTRIYDLVRPNSARKRLCSKLGFVPSWGGRFLRTTRWHAATSEGDLRTARARPQRPDHRVARRRSLFSCCRAGGGCVCKPGWLWPLRMATRCEWAGDERTRKAEHGGSEHRIRAVRLGWSLGPVRAIWARFPGACALGGSSAR